MILAWGGRKIALAFLGIFIVNILLARLQVEVHLPHGA